MTAVDVVNLTPKLAEILGAEKGATAVPTIGKLVKCFDFSKVRINDKKEQDHLHTRLAPCFGTLTEESMKGMDEKLKIMIAGTNRQLENLPPRERSWEEILSMFMQNPVIEPMNTPDGNITRADKFIPINGWKFSKFDKKRDNAVARQVLTWFIRFIGDEDVLESTKIDINVIAHIVATTGAVIENFPQFLTKEEHYERDIIDIGVLRYPDVDLPYFKVYRIQLIAWSDARHALILNKDSNGVTGKYNLRLFKPRDSVIDGMKEETKKKAIQAADDMFS